jgi:hypothetical protein
VVLLRAAFGLPVFCAKWRKRQTVEDQKTGPKEPRSTILSEDEEAMVVAFRRHTLLPLEFKREAKGPGDLL